MGGNHRKAHSLNWLVVALTGGATLSLATVFLIWFPWWGALLLAMNATVIVSLAVLLDYFVGWGRIWKELTGR